MSFIKKGVQLKNIYHMILNYWKQDNVERLAV